MFGMYQLGVSYFHKHNTGFRHLFSTDLQEPAHEDDTFFLSFHTKLSSQSVQHSVSSVADVISSLVRCFLRGSFSTYPVVRNTTD